MTGKHTETPIGRELIERLTEIAYRDTAQSVTVRSADLRAAVRAVNAHDTLVSTLEAVLRRLESEGPDTFTGSQEIIRAALSAAKE